MRFAIYGLDGPKFADAVGLEAARSIARQHPGRAVIVEDGRVVEWAPGVDQGSRSVAQIMLRKLGVIGVAQPPRPAPPAPAPAEETTMSPPKAETTPTTCDHPDGCDEPAGESRSTTVPEQRGWCLTHRKRTRWAAAKTRTTSAKPTKVATKRAPARKPARAAAKVARAPKAPAADLAPDRIRITIRIENAEVDLDDLVNVYTTVRNALGGDR